MVYNDLEIDKDNSEGRCGVRKSIEESAGELDRQNYGDENKSRCFGCYYCSGDLVMIIFALMTG
jgi:hypothetical protein